MPENCLDKMVMEDGMDTWARAAGWGGGEAPSAGGSAGGNAKSAEGMRNTTNPTTLSTVRRLVILLNLPPK